MLPSMHRLSFAPRQKEFGREMAITECAKFVIVPLGLFEVIKVYVAAPSGIIPFHDKTDSRL